MDEELKQHLDAMERRIMQRLNDQHERLLDHVVALRRDFDNTKGFLIEDALVTGRRMSAVETRLDRLERDSDKGDQS